MKAKNLFLFGSACLLAAGTLHAAINIDDSATYYDEQNWYAIRNGGEPTISGNGNSISVGNFKYDSMFFCYFNPVVLKAGEYFKVSGKLNLKTIYSGTGTNTVIGLFDSGEFPQDVLDEKLKEKSFGHAYNSKSTNLGASAVTGTMAGFLTSPKLAYNRNNPSTGSSCVATNTGGKRASDYTKEFSSPEAGKEYEFLLNVLKVADGTYTTRFSLGDGEEFVTNSLENEKLGNLSVLAFKLPVGTGGSITISDLEFETTGSVIPEPSMFGLLAGLGALALVGARRRRN